MRVNMLQMPSSRCRPAWHKRMSNYLRRRANALIKPRPFPTDFLSRPVMQWLYRAAIRPLSSLASTKLTHGIRHRSHKNTLAFPNCFFANFVWSTPRARLYWSDIRTNALGSIHPPLRFTAAVTSPSLRWTAMSIRSIARTCACLRNFSWTTRRCTTTWSLSCSTCLRKTTGKAVIW